MSLFCLSAFGCFFRISEGKKVLSQAFSQHFICVIYFCANHLQLFYFFLYVIPPRILFFFSYSRFCNYFSYFAHIFSLLFFYINTKRFIFQALFTFLVLIRFLFSQMVSFCFEFEFFSWILESLVFCFALFFFAFLWSIRCLAFSTLC